MEKNNTKDRSTKVVQPIIREQYRKLVKNLATSFNTFDMNCFGGWFLWKEGNFVSDYGWDNL